MALLPALQSTLSWDGSDIEERILGSAHRLYSSLPSSDGQPNRWLPIAHDSGEKKLLDAIDYYKKTNPAASDEHPKQLLDALGWLSHFRYQYLGSGHRLPELLNYLSLLNQD